jgi:hypothetical protein
MSFLTCASLTGLMVDARRSEGPGPLSGAAVVGDQDALDGEM